MMDNPGYDDPEENTKNNNTYKESTGNKGTAYATEWSNGGPG